jgi:hypothetical protein
VLIETLKIMETWVSVKSSGTSDVAELPLLIFIAEPPMSRLCEGFHWVKAHRHKRLVRLPGACVNLKSNVSQTASGKRRLASVAL